MYGHDDIINLSNKEVEQKMAHVVNILIDLENDINKSEELFGVKPDDLTPGDVSEEFAKNWNDKWFKSLDNKETPQERYVSWFKKATNVIKNDYKVALK